MRSSRLKAAKLLQFEEDGGAEAAETTAAAKGGADEEESGQSLEATAAAAEEDESGNVQDGRVPEQHDEHEHEQGWRDFIPFVSLPESNSERLNRWTILWSCECPILH